MRLVIVAMFLFPLISNAVEVIRPDFHNDIELNIIRATDDGFDSYALTNENGREMNLVCKSNRFYGNNIFAFLEYRNYYNAIAGQFKIEKNEVCKDLANFIRTSYSAIDEQRSIKIILDRKKIAVKKIVYPNVDEFIVHGDEKDLLPKKNKSLTPRSENILARP